MKKIMVIFLVIVLFAGIVNAEETKNVIIKYKESYQSKISLFSKNMQSDTYIIPEEKIRHDFGDMKSAILTISEINELKNNLNIEILEIPQRNIFMDDAIHLTNSTNVWPHKENTINITGLGETICIIDTGIYYNHADFGDCYGNNTDMSCKVIGGWDYCADDINCTSEDSIPNDMNGHGTHVAGIAAANGGIKGIAPDAKIVMIKAANATGALWDDDIRAGIDFCINHAEEFNISTISMSLGGGSYNGYCDLTAYDPNNIISAINNAVSKNITVTSATGNNGYNNSIAFPACIKNVTRIGSITKSNDISSFTNKDNSFTDLLLTFGESIYSTYNNGGYITGSGTSMSTPMAAGMITLLKQYKKLESNKILTNDEVKRIFLNSSKIYEDDSSNGNYSIINSLAAILFSDEKSPEITMLPENDSVLSKNQSFSCNATDLQLANLTIKLYNITGLIKNQTTTENALTIYYNTTNNDYNWSCEAIDNNSNSIIQTNILSSNSILVNIYSDNDKYTKNNETEFNCSVASSQELSNITFNIYNETGLLDSTNKNISGTSNDSIFNYNFTVDGDYYFACIATDNNSQSSHSENYTITYDTLLPKINLISPTNNSRTTSPIDFTYNETEINKDLCNLTINNITNNIFTRTLSDGFYEWNVTCADLANNINSSETFNLEIYTTPVIPSSSSGGGGSSSSSISNNIYQITEEEIKVGIETKLKINDIIKFKSNSQDHQLSLNKIETTQVEITVESDPIIVTLYIGSPIKIDIDNDHIYDLEISLISIIYGSANIKIKEINESIPTKHIFAEIIEPAGKIPIEEVYDPLVKENSEEPIRGFKALIIFNKIIDFFKRYIWNGLIILLFISVFALYKIEKKLKSKSRSKKNKSLIEIKIKSKN